MSKLDTRNKILDTAEKLFSENGIDGVSTKVIAKESGISEMTLFNHFNSKDLLYKSIIKEKRHAIDITSVFDKLSYQDLKEDLTIITSRLIDCFYENLPILQMRLKEKNILHNEIDKDTKEDPVYIQIISVFDKYLESNSINLDSEKAALMFVLTFKGLFHITALENRESDEVKDLVQLYVSIFCDGINKKNNLEN